MNKTACLPIALCSGLASIGFAMSANQAEMPAAKFAELSNKLFVDGKSVEISSNPLPGWLSVAFGGVAIASLAVWASGSSTATAENALSPIGDDALILPVGEEGDRPGQAVSSKLEQRKAELWALIQNHEEGWIGQGLAPSCCLVVGPQGSGKTTFVIALALLRKLYCQHTVEVNDPHGHQNEWGKYGLSVFGSRKNYGQIGDRITDYYQRLETKNLKSPPHTTIWDELTQYSSQIDESIVGGFMASLLSDTRKAREHSILISHNDKAGGLGGSSKTGTHQMKEQGLLSVHLQMVRSPIGEPIPAMKGMVKGLDFDAKGNAIEHQITIPSWLNPEWIVANFPELARVASPITAVNNSDQLLPKKTSVDALEKSLDLTNHLLNELASRGRNEPGNETENRFQPLPETETNGNELETNETTEGEGIEAIAFTPESFSKRFPETSETVLFAQIKQGFRNGLPPSDIVKNCLRLGKGRYQEGKALCVYLVRKYGSPELISHFSKWLID